METKYLREICCLIRDHTSYSSFDAIAKRVAISERTLRGYWDPERGGSKIPKKNISKFVSLVQEIIPKQLSDDGAEALLKGHPVQFLNYLMPCGGKAWASLIDEATKNPPLLAHIKPYGSMGFGQVDEPPPKDAANAKLFDRFYFEAQFPFIGEAALIAEHDKEWRVVGMGNDQRTVMTQRGAANFPPSNSDRQLFLQQKQKSGFYRYYVIGYRGRFGEDITAKLNQVNPIDQLRLDLFADFFLSLPKHNRYIAYGGLYVSDGD